MRLIKWIFLVASLSLFAWWLRAPGEFSGFWDGFIGGILIAGVFGLISVEFSRYLTARREPDLDMKPGETLLKRDVASWARGFEVVRGKLFLTDRALRFRARTKGARPVVFDIPLSQIQGIEKHNHRGIFPFGLKIRTSAGEVYPFLLENRRSWMQALERGTGHSIMKKS